MKNPAHFPWRPTVAILTAAFVLTWWVSRDGSTETVGDARPHPEFGKRDVSPSPFPRPSGVAMQSRAATPIRQPMASPHEALPPEDARVMHPPDPLR